MHYIVPNGCFIKVPQSEFAALYAVAFRGQNSHTHLSPLAAQIQELHRLAWKCGLEKQW
ncbi:hypothetical protein CH063_16006 [Colletotrichum higginsianum]|uniref:Uncharacterized protein n=1 Tax=Colletotrichum higginsianum (strain IMI 349063) TaxID=759273 RepID=H1W5H2_COLHI|nr:hypothetical protein CH063_16006 [Colletotrichum higginsianum]